MTDTPLALAAARQGLRDAHHYGLPTAPWEALIVAYGGELEPPEVAERLAGLCAAERADEGARPARDRAVADLLRAALAELLADRDGDPR